MKKHYLHYLYEPSLKKVCWYIGDKIGKLIHYKETIETDIKDLDDIDVLVIEAAKKAGFDPEMCINDEDGKGYVLSKVVEDIIKKNKNKKKILSIGESLEQYSDNPNMNYLEVEVNKEIKKYWFPTTTEIQLSLEDFKDYVNFENLKNYFEKSISSSASQLGKKSAEARKKTEKSGEYYKALAKKGGEALKKKYGKDYYRKIRLKKKI